MSKISAEQCRAWKRISEARTCPPIDVLAAGGPDVERHLKGCPVCRDALEQHDLFNMIADEVKSYKTISEDKPIAIGQIRSLKRDEQGLFRDGICHNPPLVLVLDVLADDPSLVKVAQIFNEPALKCEQDIPVSNEYFAEGWNTYHVGKSMFNRAIAEVSQQVVDAVLAAGSQQPVIQEDSPMEAFHSLELEIARFYEVQHVVVPKVETTFFTRLKTRQWRYGAIAAAVCLIWAGIHMFSSEYTGNSGDMIAALQNPKLITELSSIRGGEDRRVFSRTFAWEKLTDNKSLSEEAREYAYGQWSARNAVAPDGQPFPAAMKVKDTAKGSPYRDLGALAYAADVGCSNDRKELANSMKQPLGKMAKSLQAHLKAADELALLGLLTQDNPMCGPVGDALDSIEQRMFTR